MSDPMELVGRLELYAKEASEIDCPNTASDLTEAAACIREMVEWRPIETAPMDGTEVLLRTRDGLISCSWDWTQNEWGSSWLGIVLLPGDATHWLPLR